MILFGLLILTTSVLSVQAQSTSNDNLYKFDDGFEKIQNMQDAGLGGAAEQSGDTSHTHSVIIITDDGNKDRVERVLQELGAQNIFKSSSLDS